IPICPTRADGSRSSIPSRIPLPARRIDTRHSFLPASKGKLALSSGVSISLAARGSSRVASYANNRLISRSSLRNSAVEVLRSRISDSLCWTSGCSTTVKLVHCCCNIASSEQRAVADDGERRTAVAPLKRDLPSGRPAAAFQHPVEWKIAGILAQTFTHEDRQVIEQGHGQCTPLDDGFAQCIERALQDTGVTRCDDAAIQEQAAIAVFGETGQPIQLDDPQTASLKRLDQRIGQPLTKLMKRHQPVAGYGGMLAAIAERDASKADPAGPDRSERMQQGAKHLGCWKWFVACCPIIVEAAEPG